MGDNTVLSKFLWCQVMLGFKKLQTCSLIHIDCLGYKTDFCSTGDWKLFMSKDLICSLGLLITNCGYLQNVVPTLETFVNKSISWQ